MNYIDIAMHERLLILLNHYWVAGYATALGASDPEWKGTPFREATKEDQEAWLEKACEDLFKVFSVQNVTVD